MLDRINIKSHKVSASYSKAFQYSSQKHFGGHHEPHLPPPPMSNRVKIWQNTCTFAKLNVVLLCNVFSSVNSLSGQMGLLSRSEGNPSRRRKPQIQIKTALMKIPQCSIPYRIVRRADKQGTRPSVTGQAEVENVLLAVTVCHRSPQHQVQEL